MWQRLKWASRVEGTVTQILTIITFQKKKNSIWNKEKGLIMWFDDPYGSEWAEEEAKFTQRLEFWNPNNPKFQTQSNS